MAQDTGSPRQRFPITPRSYACRDAARLQLGDEYVRRLSRIGGTLQSAAQAADCDLLEVAYDAARGLDGVDALQILAAAVEILEPST